MTTAATRRPPTQGRPVAAPSRVGNLLGLQGLPRDTIVSILRRSAELRELGPNVPQSLRGKAIATLFFEDSTRTRTSFNLAARRLGADVVDLSSGSSSVNKGETLVDTARTVEAMGVDALVVRAKHSGAASIIQRSVRVPVINAGDGRHEHPTQGLLDAATIATAHHRPDFDLSGLTVAIVGDVVNSRVARSNIASLTTLGAATICVGPPAMSPRSLESLGTRVSHDLDKVLPIADVVMMLRVQFERQGESPLIASIRDYRDAFALTEARAARLKPGTVVLHPGPMNRGIEIDAEVADGPRSRILDQVSWGVLVRMAVLESCVLAR